MIESRQLRLCRLAFWVCHLENGRYVPISERSLSTIIRERMYLWHLPRPSHVSSLCRVNNDGVSTASNTPVRHTSTEHTCMDAYSIPKSREQTPARSRWPSDTVEEVIRMIMVIVHRSGNCSVTFYRCFQRSFWIINTIIDLPFAFESRGSAMWLTSYHLLPSNKRSCNSCGGTSVGRLSTIFWRLLCAEENCWPT